MKTDVAVVVVTYNSARSVAGCLRSLRAVAETVVVDNASADDTCRIVEEMFPTVQLIRNPENRGFAAAVNQEVQASSSPLILLLNPDAALLTPLDDMVRQCLIPDVGAVGGRLVDAAGRPQVGFNVRSFPTPAALACEVLLLNRLWPSNPVNRRYRRLNWDPERPQDVDQPAGAFLMVRREVFENVGLLDENFTPIWFEDVDLCLRIRLAGYRICYVPTALARHEGGHSLQGLSVEQRQLAWYGNLLRFAHKHFPASAFHCLRPMVLAGVVVRWLVVWLRAGDAGQRKAYAQVMRLVVGRGQRRPGHVPAAADHSSTIEYRSS